MKALLITQQETDKNLKSALSEKFAKFNTINLKDVHLIIKKENSYIKLGKLNINDYDFIYPLISPSLESFVEPLLEEIEKRNIITPFSSSSFYSLNNEPLLFTILANSKIPVPKIMINQNPKKLSKQSLKFKFPCLLKVFHKNKKIQTTLFDTHRSLNFYLEGMRLEPDVLFLREFIEKDVLSCLVIGKTVFALKRKWNGFELEDYQSIALSSKEKSLVLKTSETLGLEIAKIKVSNGKIIGVELPNLALFQKKTGEDIYSFIAKYFYKKSEETKEQRKHNDLIGSITKTIQGVLK